MSIDDKKFQFEVLDLQPLSKHQQPAESCSGCAPNPDPNPGPNPGCSNCSAPCSAGCEQNCESDANHVHDNEKENNSPPTKNNLCDWGDNSKKMSFWKTSNSEAEPKLQEESHESQESTVKSIKSF